MEDENEVIYPGTGKSVSFALGFFIVYVIIVFAVLEIFFGAPF